MFLNFFDKIIVINLPHRGDRRDEMEEELNRHGIPFEFYDAIYDPNRGADGLVRTMIKLFTELLATDVQNALILEDDAKFLVTNPVNFLAEILPQLPKDYDLFYLGLNLLTKPTRISENILRVADCYSTHAICYSREGMKFALDRLQEVPMMPYDIFMRQEVVCRGRSYCTFPMMMTQRQSYSDIEKATPQWDHLMMTTFNMFTKNLYITMANEIAYCIHGHEINGQIPIVEQTNFQVQHPELIGKPCDCGRFTYNEGKCPTCQGDRWRVIWEEKK